jgi:hypothetical protein
MTTALAPPRERQEQREDPGIDELYQISHEVWNRIQGLLRPPKKHKSKDRSGRHRIDDRNRMNRIYIS